MPTRRPLLKRVALWTTAVVLLLAWYPLAAPFVVMTCVHRVPSAMPAITIIYGPLDYFFRHDELPGCAAYRTYVEACSDMAEEAIRP